jgi:RNA polymerase sigma-70 factor (ECF subfamily)
LPEPKSPEITRMLAAWRDGDQAALSELAPHVYNELRRLASGCLAGEKGEHILQPTALVNEAFLRLMDWRPPQQWLNREHFFGVSATLMRRILVQLAREQKAAKRGGGAIQVSLSEASGLKTLDETDLVALDQALTELEELDARQVRIVEMRFFGGLSLEQIAELLEVSFSTVRRDLRMAQAWLRQRLASAS